MLEEVYASYKELADIINWKQYEKSELFREYIKHENDSDAMNYYSGIICRYWGYAAKIYSQCNQHVAFEQCYDVLLDTVNYVLKKRVWENPKSSLYENPAGPDIAFHIVLKRQRGLLLSNLSAEKRKTNFNTLSIDSIHDDYSDAAEGLFDIYDNSAEEMETNSQLISFIKQHEPLYIVILDLLTQTYDKTVRALSTALKDVTAECFQYFNDRYAIDKEAFDKVVEYIARCDSKRLQFDIKKAMQIVKDELKDIYGNN